MPYTIANLKEVEDAAPRFGLAPEVEARFARRALGGEQVGLAYERLAPNARMPFGHKHGEQEEIYVVVGGSGRVKIDEEIVEVRRWDAVRVGTDTMRNFEAGQDGLELIVFGAPTHENDDAELVHGWWVTE